MKPWRKNSLSKLFLLLIVLSLFSNIQFESILIVNILPEIFVFSDFALFVRPFLYNCDTDTGEIGKGLNIIASFSFVKEMLLRINFKLDRVNPLVPGVHWKVTHIETNLQLKAAGLFKYVCPLVDSRHRKVIFKNRLINITDLLFSTIWRLWKLVSKFCSVMQLT